MWNRKHARQQDGARERGQSELEGELLGGGVRAVQGLKLREENGIRWEGSVKVGGLAGGVHCLWLKGKVSWGVLGSGTVPDSSLALKHVHKLRAAQPTLSLHQTDDKQTLNRR